MSEVADMMAQSMLVLTPIFEVCIISTVIVAFWQRARLATVRMMRERNDAIAARDQDERDIAALAERARIARDMHDVVAHTLSIIIVQSDGGRYAGTHDPAVARNTMETIRHESERALHDMQRLLGVFGGSPHADYNDIGKSCGTSAKRLPRHSNPTEYHRHRQPRTTQRTSLDSFLPCSAGGADEYPQVCGAACRCAY